ncbi:MAG: arsenite methyltransferase [Saprospiraceae bacterium]|nr:arsenite methyltransferase [Saprospiraceae bacterium]
MKTELELKELVRQKYSELALQEKSLDDNGCCGTTACCGDVYNVMADDYTQLEGYNPDADLNLGCGLPTQFAKIKPGDTVIDLGSGAGNDVFIARHETGESGKVIGIDFTETMIAKARQNAEKLGFNNVEFRYGDIEEMPVGANIANVIVSNCVLNLVPNKANVFKEIMRVLKPGGHFSISDIVLVGDLPKDLQEAAEMYAGCVSGAIQKEEYLGLIRQTGFESIELQKEKAIIVPDDILLQYISEADLKTFKESEIGIYSITVFARKPECCEPGNGCC